MRLFDTDVADTNDSFNVKAVLQNTAAGETVDPAGMPVTFTRGCFVELSGTQVNEAIVMIGHAVGYGSDGAIRNYALRRNG